MRTRIYPGTLLAVLVTACATVYAQDTAGIQKALEGEYHLTKTTDDKTDIVTAGSVILLHKDKVLMVGATSTANPCMNFYKEGKIVPTKACGVGERIKKFGHLFPGSGSAPSVTTRNFVSGEKFWITKIDVKENAVVFDFFTDAINDTRYIAALTIPFGAFTPTPEQALKAVHEVITAEPAEDSKDAKGDQQQQQAPAPQGGQQEAPAEPAPAPPPAAQPAEAAPAPLAPPPPPPADPVEVKVGMSTEEVVAALGQPVKKAKTSTKEIYFYKDLKVTFVNGKVKDVE